MYVRRRFYLAATRHPWPCLVFLLPLLTAYETGVVWLGGTRPEALRNGADTWLHWALDSFGLSQLYWTPGLIAAVFLAWSWVRRYDRPGDLFGVCAGMALESGAFAAGLWGLSRSLRPFLEWARGVGAAAGLPILPVVASLRARGDQLSTILYLGFGT